MDKVPNDGLIRYIFANKEYVLLTDPRALGEVLTKNPQNFLKLAYLRKGLGRSWQRRAPCGRWRAQKTA